MYLLFPLNQLLGRNRRGGGGGTIVRYVGLIPSVLQNDDLFNKEHSVCVLFG